jgi:hypothetical protein
MGPFLAYFAYHHSLLHHVGPAIQTLACLRTTMLGANWVYRPSGSDFGQAHRRSLSQASHVSHLEGVFYLLLHRHKIQRTTVKSHG